MCVPSFVNKKSFLFKLLQKMWFYGNIFFVFKNWPWNFETSKCLIIFFIDTTKKPFQFPFQQYFSFSLLLSGYFTIKRNEKCLSVGLVGSALFLRVKQLFWAEPTRKTNFQLTTFDFWGFMVIILFVIRK